jgi:hypothetical protein
MAMVGAGVGGGFVNTNELRTMTFDEAMKSSDKDEWLKAVQEEYKNMSAVKLNAIKNNVEGSDFVRHRDVYVRDTP